MAKRDVELVELDAEIRLRPRNERAMQFMAENFFGDTYVWEGNVLVVELKKSEIVIAILEDASFIVR